MAYGYPRVFAEVEALVDGDRPPRHRGDTRKLIYHSKDAGITQPRLPVCRLISEQKMSVNFEK